MPNGHIHASILTGGRKYDVALEDSGKPVMEGHLLVGEDNDETTILVLANTDEDLIHIGSLGLRVSLQAIRELVHHAGPPMTGTEAASELGLANDGEVWDLVDKGLLIEVGKQRGRRMVGAAGVMRMKGHDMDHNNTISYHEASELLGLSYQTLKQRVKRGDLTEARKGLGAAQARRQGVEPREALLDRASVIAFKGSEQHARALHFAARAAKRLATQAKQKAKQSAEAPTVKVPEPTKPASLDEHRAKRAAETTGSDLIDLQLAVMDGYAMGLDAHGDDTLIGLLGRLRELLGKELP